MPNNGSPVRLHPDNPRYCCIAAAVGADHRQRHYGRAERNFDYVRYLNEAADKAMTNSRCFLLSASWRALPHTRTRPASGAADYVARSTHRPGLCARRYPRFDLIVGRRVLLRGCTTSERGLSARHRGSN